MRNPELNDAIAPRSKADAAITRAALNQSRLDNKKGAAKKAEPKKKAAPKPTDSRFTGKLSGTGSPAKPKSGAGSMAYTPGSAKSGKATYTTGSGVRYTPSSTKPKNLAAEVAKSKANKKPK